MNKENISNQRSADSAPLDSVARLDFFGFSVTRGIGYIVVVYPLIIESIIDRLDTMITEVIRNIQGARW